MKHIAILDLGSQYTHLISRAVREFNVLSKIYPNDTSAAELDKSGALGIIISGGPQTVFKNNALTVDKKIFEMGLPVLGLCYGHQLMAHILGGEVRKGLKGEYGRALLDVLDGRGFFEGVENRSTVWMSHGDTVTELPQGFKRTGQTEHCAITAMSDKKRHFYGLQFHPEVEHTKFGKKMIGNFVLNICGAEQNWQVKDLVDDLLQKIKEQAGDRNVFILVSGGVDSSVALTLLTKALGEERVMGLYIDTGFMRKHESKEILEGYAKAGFHNLKMVDAGEIFFNKLKNVYDPEEKRRIIGQAFLDTKDRAISDLGLRADGWLLGQGTIYPDTIESGGSKNSDKIKTHHNRIDAVQALIDKGLVIEPLVDFYKDEVRQIGKLLGLPDALVERHPFPGPGLAIRCLCHEKSKDFCANKKTETKLAELYKNDLSHIGRKILPIRSVGVQGDNRTYANPLAVWNEDNWEKLDELSTLTTNSIKEINRVLLLLNPENHASLKIADNSLVLDKGRIELLQEIDHLVMQRIKQAGLYGQIWQFPVILVPLVDENGRESIVLRPFVSRDVMTLEFARLKREFVKLMQNDILSTGKISYVFYDLTNKPPGTVEWE